jgi:hypothetical protein
MTIESLLAITPYPPISALLWVVIAVVTLYLARSSAHKIVLTVCRTASDIARLAARSILQAEQKLCIRNREVLLAAGREAKERIIEREFERVADSVKKDLAGYPGLQRSLSEAITRIEEDHQRAVDVPPDPPGWVKAIDAIAKIDSSKDGSVSAILRDIHQSLAKAQQNAIAEYRTTSRKRHELLRGMMPQWRTIQQSLNRVEKVVESLLSRSRSIDRHMEDYENIARGTDRAVAVLSSSSLVQFFVSALVLGVAVGGATVNFSLIARPMAEMVGGTMFIGSFRTADIAALVIIFVEISMGLFLMESLRITRLFPVISALPDRTRMRMVWVTFTILTLLATVESGLAYMRELLMQDTLATTALLRGGAEVAESEYVWITTAAQMGMGFTLPFALVFVAIPLETFIHSLRTVVGLSAIGLLRALRLLLRVIAHVALRIGVALTRAYDILIFMPLWLDATLLRPKRAKGGYMEVSS